jgi:hypothetical protein
MSPAANCFHCYCQLTAIAAAAHQQLLQLPLHWSLQPPVEPLPPLIDS